MLAPAARECGGCAAKASPEVVAALLRSLRGRGESADVLVGLADADDAAVIALDDERALITTIDACPPMVEDPQEFGAIAAANAVGDVLAMGGRVVSALALLAFPRDGDPRIGAAMLRGAREVVEQCGGSLVGGHTVHAPGTLFGLSVTGLVHPDRIWRTRGAQPGDLLVLSRPIGVGIAVSHAGGSGRDEIVHRLRTPAVSEAATLAGLGDRVHAVTDVTGFGLLGHALDFTDEGIGIDMDVECVPMIPGAVELARAGHRTSAHEANTAWIVPKVDDRDCLDEASWAMLVDPQTTGGLLAAIDGSCAPTGFTAIGHVVRREPGEAAIRIVPSSGRVRSSSGIQWKRKAGAA